MGTDKKSDNVMDNSFRKSSTSNKSQGNNFNTSSRSNDDHMKSESSDVNSIQKDKDNSERAPNKKAKYTYDSGQEINEIQGNWQTN